MNVSASSSSAIRICSKRQLYTGCPIPPLGIGTFGSDKYDADTVAQAVYGAIACGYRLIDCASVYQNEAQVGQALRRAMDEGLVKRLRVK